ncbi:Protochlorophyllide-dependent translocon component 52, chloroplastic [Linum perenne]
MEAISFTKTFTLPFQNPISSNSRLTNFRFRTQPVSNLHGRRNSSRSKLFASSAVSTAADRNFGDPPMEESMNVGPEEEEEEGEKFDWFAYWYPVMPVCDLDKRIPHAKTVLGLDLVAWWDRNESAWKVFDDMCPHRLAPLSEGRIDQWGRLQCVYHGWCFNGAGECKLIPQAPLDGPPVHTSKRACASVYPSTVQNGILWVWPNSDPKYSDVLSVQKPPYISELDDPSFTKPMANRDFPFGYEILTENLIDPSHVPYAHFKLLPNPTPKERVDREGGSPVEMKLEKFGINGFNTARFGGESKFIAPCVYYSSLSATALREISRNEVNGSASAFPKVNVITQKRVLIVFLCIPVGPGKSRLIFSFPRNFAVWADKLIPRWISHVGLNLVLDSDLYLLHLEERKIMEAGISNWSKACFMPTKADTQVIAFRRWLRRYSGGQINWGAKFKGVLPPTPPKEQLMDRYWSHVVNCSSCNGAYKALKAVEVMLKIVTVASIAIVAATAKQSAALRGRVVLGVSAAVLCYAASRWLAHFVYKTFHFHDYTHALV